MGIINFLAKFFHKYLYYPKWKCICCGKEIFDNHNIILTYYDCVVDYILKFIEDEKEFGARPIARAIETELIDKISDAILSSEEDIRECIFTVDENDKLVMRAIQASVWDSFDKKLLEM